MREVDFLPERIRRQRRRWRRMLRQGYLLAACVATMGALTYVRQGHLVRAEGQLVALSERAQNIQRQIAMIPHVQRQMADLLIKKRIDAELGSRADCTGVLAELCRLAPPNITLISLELRTVNLRVSPVRPSRRSSFRSAVAAGAKSPNRAATTVRRVRLMLTGLAPTDMDVANLIGQLSASCLFEDVNMGYAKTVTFQDRSAKEFQASCYLAK